MAMLHLKGEFDVGDKVKMPGISVVVEALELTNCQDCGAPSFRFKDPETGEDDFMHKSEFYKVD